MIVVLALGLGALLRPMAFLGAPWDGVAPNVAAGALFALAALGVERALLGLDVWSVAGAVVGLLVGGLSGAVLVHVLPDEAGRFPAAAWSPFIYLVALYLGGVGGAHLSAAFRDHTLTRLLVGRPGGPKPQDRILDTSVIIDGRIADVAETGFLDGTFVVPGFVLRELQHVADSPDALRRARGRKGLEVLQRLRKLPAIQIFFSQEEIPEIREVDEKLVELARRTGAKLVTNDFNLNRVASLQGIEVLNLNDLSHALRPVVLPGETLRVAVTKEGKEAGQGIAYLDDGTMVVVDQGRPLIGRSVDIVITSVIQTAAGKMFFGRPSDRSAAESS